MPGFVKVANEVFRTFRKPTRLAVAVRLYDMADTHRWKPFPAADRFLMESGASLWIEHDFAANALLDKSPAYYE